MSIYFSNFIFFDCGNKKPVIVLKKTQNTVSMIGFSLKKILTLKFNRICFSKVLFSMHFKEWNVFDFSVYHLDSLYSLLVAGSRLEILLKSHNLK